MPREFVLFVYGTSMRGEPKHAPLETATFAGEGTTSAAFDLVDLGADAAMAPGGRTAVTGEVYVVTVDTLAELDREAGHPIVFKRTPVVLTDGRTVETYLLEADQVRGRRRVRSGNWRTRGQRARVTDGGPLVRWARDRRRF